MSYPLVALFSYVSTSLNTRANFSSTYVRTRKGRREVVRKSQNRLKVERGRVSARVSVPLRLRSSAALTVNSGQAVNKGEVYGLGVGSLRSDRRNIREEFRPSIGQRGFGIQAQGNLGRYQIKARGYTGYNPNA